MRVAAPHVIVLLLPASPDGSWGNALTTAANAARVGIRVVMVAPSREIVEPLAAVAGAERALSRSEVLSRPLVVVERHVGSGLVGGGVAPAMPLPRATAAAASRPAPPYPPAWPSRPAPSPPAPPAAPWT